MTQTLPPPDFGEATNANVEAWQMLRKQVMSMMTRIRNLHKELEDGRVEKAPAYAQLWAAAARRTIDRMERTRRLVLETPLPGSNVASKMAGAIDITHAFTADDLTAAVPLVDHGHDYLSLFEFLRTCAETADDAKLGAIWNEMTQVTAARARYLGAPKGTTDVSDDLKAARGAAPEDWAALADDIEV